VVCQRLNIRFLMLGLILHVSLLPFQSYADNSRDNSFLIDTAYDMYENLSPAQKRKVQKKASRISQEVSGDLKTIFELREIGGIDNLQANFRAHKSIRDRMSSRMMKFEKTRFGKRVVKAYEEMLENKTLDELRVLFPETRYECQPPGCPIIIIPILIVLIIISPILIPYEAIQCIKGKEKGVFFRGDYCDRKSKRRRRK